MRYYSETKYRKALHEMYFYLQKDQLNIQSADLYTEWV